MKKVLPLLLVIFTILPTCYGRVANNVTSQTKISGPGKALIEAAKPLIKLLNLFRSGNKQIREDIRYLNMAFETIEHPIPGLDPQVAAFKDDFIDISISFANYLNGLPKSDLKSSSLNQLRNILTKIQSVNVQ